MNTLNANTKGKVLIVTNDRTYPFIIKYNDDSSYPYLLVQKNGKLSGDGYSLEEVIKDFPNCESLE
jgi:hypothetical protein